MKTFGLIGEKLSHSFSPQIHRYLADYDYRLFEIQPQDLAEFLRRADFDGLNVTIPYKKTVIPYCADLSDSARKIGSVNTIIKRPDGSLYGDNTDYYGFSYLLKKLGVVPSGKKALIFGSGGSSLTVRAVLEDQGAGPVITISRGGTDNYTNLERHTDASLIVNTTPVGMYPHNGISAADLALFKSCEAVADIVYNPYRTALLLDAEDLGIPCINGLPMLVAQAKRAAEIFTGKKISDDVIDRIADDMTRQTKNVVLIGMPGSGKSTTGAALALLTGRPFFDTDELIVEKAGRSIPEFFASEGETAFRALETNVLREVSKKSGCVIATGGGIVKVPENLRLIRQNSVCVFLDREVSDLPTDGRPLSLKSGTETLARERLPLYNAWCNVKTAVVGVSETAANIKELLGL